MITKKQTDVIRILLNNSEPVAAEDTASAIGSSVRTIQRYVDLINDEFTGSFAIVLERGHGCRLVGNLNEVQKLISQNMNVTGSDFRSNLCLLQLIEGNGISAENLARRLMVRRSTVNKILPEVKDQLQQYDLSLNARSART